MDQARRRALLGKTDVMGRLPDAVLTALATEASVVRLAPSQTLFRQGDLGDSLYIVSEGQLEVHLGDARLDVVGEGESFGEISVFTEEPRSASVRALTHATLLMVPREGFRAALDRHPEAMSSGLLRDLARKMKSSIRVRVDQHNTNSRLQEAFARSVSPEVMEEVLTRANPLQLLDGEEKTATVVFADLRNFTTLSETIPPKQVLALLNTHLAAAVDVLLAHRGTLDKFLGDGLMALFGVPITTDDDARRAVRCVWEMQAKMMEVSPKESPIKMGIGLATGPVVAGCVGGQRRMEYTVIGDVANLASRLEGLTKVYRTDILMCGTTAAGAGHDLTLRRVDRVRAKGRRTPTEVFDLLGPRTSERVELAARYDEAYEDYAAGRFKEAGVRFAELAAATGDGPSHTLAERCLGFAAAAPASWDGVFTMEHK